MQKSTEIMPKLNESNGCFANRVGGGWYHFFGQFLLHFYASINGKTQPKKFSGKVNSTFNRGLTSTVRLAQW